MSRETLSCAAHPARRSAADAAASTLSAALLKIPFIQSSLKKEPAARMLPWSVPVSVRGILPHWGPSGEILPAGSERGRESAVSLPHAHRNPPGETEGSATRLQSSPASRSPCARSRDSCAGFRSPSSPERVREAPGRGEERRKSHAPPRPKAPPPSPSPSARCPAISHLSPPRPSRRPSASAPQRHRISPASGETP